MYMDIFDAFSHVKAFVFDVDGVLTDSTIYLLGNGEQARRMNIKDGYALQLAINKGYKVIVMSGADASSAELRLQRLGITDLYFGVISKLTLLQQILGKYHITPSQVLYMGDDIPDAEVMKYSGLPCCPSDAVPEIKSISFYISSLPGGYGCVRDVIEKVLKLNGDWGNDTLVPSK